MIIREEGLRVNYDFRFARNFCIDAKCDTLIVSYLVLTLIYIYGKIGHNRSI